MPRLTVSVVNIDNEPIKIEWHECKVKTRGGVYKRLNNNTNTDTIQPGDTASTVYNATFGAGVKRRYQIAVNNGDSDAVIYFPSSSSWTEDDTPTIRARV